MQKALIIGAGLSGKSVNKLLKKIGIKTYIVDDKKKIRFKPLKDRLLSGLSFVIVSPGVDPCHYLVQEAKNMGIAVYGELDFASKFLCSQIVAITGTNGKTTTTTLVYEILKQVFSCFVGGNIGVPVSSFCLKEHEVSVLETSSFQLENISTFKPSIACLLNITPDHLNRHKTMRNYINAKLNIFKNMDEKGFACLNKDDRLVNGLDLSFIKAKTYFFSTKVECIGCYVKKGCIYFNNGIEKQKLFNVDLIPLLGEHNLSNVLCACLVACLLGVEPSLISMAIQNFKGVSHRLEYVCSINGVAFINDSKATNISSTIVAVKAMNKPTTLILGGSDKGFDFDLLFESMTDQIKNFVVVGQTTQKIVSSAIKYKMSNVFEAKSFKEAVKLAYNLAGEGENVLLSPACASFDMFSSFEERGRVFVSLVREIEKYENSKITNKKKGKV